MVRFSPGRLVATAAALEAVEASGDDLLAFVYRHLRGDWGDVHPEDRGLNDVALKDGSRLMSVYKLKNGDTIWIITDARNEQGVREATTALLPSDY